MSEHNIESGDKDKETKEKYENFMKIWTSSIYREGPGIPFIIGSLEEEVERIKEIFLNNKTE